MWNAGLDEAQGGIKIAWRNINNLIYADDIPLMAESKEEQESLDKGKRGEWKTCLKINIQKTEIMTSSPLTSCQIDGGKVETVTHFIFLGSKIIADADYS